MEVKQQTWCRQACGGWLWVRADPTGFLGSSDNTLHNLAADFIPTSPLGLQGTFRFQSLETHPTAPQATVL